MYIAPTRTLASTFEHGFGGGKPHDAMGKPGAVPKYRPSVDRCRCRYADAERVLNLPVQSSCSLTGSEILKADSLGGRVIIEMRTPLV